MQQKSRKKNYPINGMRTSYINFNAKWVQQKKKKKNNKTLNTKELCNMSKEAKP